MTPDAVSVWGYFQEFFLVQKIVYKVVAFGLLTGLILTLGRSFGTYQFLQWARNHARMLAFVVFAMGFALRIAWVNWVPHLPSSEEIPLLQHARDLADGNGFIYNGHPTARRSVGYCLFLALFYLADKTEWIGFVHALLSASVSVCLYLLGREMKGPVTGVAAAALWAFFPTAIFASSLILDEHVCMPLMLLGLYFALVHVRRTEWRYLVFSGLCLGLGALARPIPSVLPAAIFLTFWIGAFSFWQSLKRSALIAAIVVLCAAPWALRNWVTMGSPVLYCISQYGFYWANNSSYDVRFPVNPTPQAGEDPEIVLARDMYHAGGPGEVIYSEVTVRKAREWILQNPVLFLKKTAGKAFHLLGFSEEEWAIASNTQRLVPGKSMPEGRAAQWALIKSQNWSYVLVFFSAVGGLVFFFLRWAQGTLNKTFLLMLLAAAQIFVMTVLYLAHVKYRYMLDPFFVLGCAYYWFNLYALGTPLARRDP